MDKVSKSTPKNIIDLYTKIPDYAEVKHLGNSEFINTLERLKEEFRHIRSSLYEESDVELISEKTNKILNIRKNKNGRDEIRKVNYLSSRCNSSGNYFFNSDTSSTTIQGNGQILRNQNFNNKNNTYLAVKSCQLYRSPFAVGSSNTISPAQNIPVSKPGLSNYHSSSKFYNPINYESKINSMFQENDDDDEDEDDEISMGESGRSSSQNSLCSSPLSRWSSNPEIRTSTLGKFKEYIPPSNVENRLLLRKPQNQSEPLLTKSEEISTKVSKVHSVPSNVKKLLYDKIMLNNKKRSQRVRESSKQKLLSQVKPFSFTKRVEKNLPLPQPHKNINEFTSREMEILNNTKPVKTRKVNNVRYCIKTNNNKFESSNTHLFKANPAPPRSRALLAAIRLREQQEYRELKKRLRSETLMKTASLPPSMAARDKETKDNQSRLQTILNKLETSYGKSKSKNRKQLERSSSTDTTYTDEDRMTDTSITTRKKHTPRITTIVEPFNFSKSGSSHGFRLGGITNGIFESTSNDNNASRLRVQAAKQKEQIRIKREEEEYLRLMRIENARQNLRDSKLQVWRRACSYSSSQDIAMRRQLRMAASILERQAFQKDMSTMLNRVRSAPLLLEGVRERKFEPCKKHLQEMLHLSDRSIKFSKPEIEKHSDKHYCTRINWTSRGDGLGEHCGTEMSETVAMAEGTMTNSDNESIRNIDLDSEAEKQECENLQNENEDIIDEVEDENQDQEIQ